MEEREDEGSKKRQNDVEGIEETYEDEEKYCGERILQLDGNMSMLSEDSESDEKIPVVLGNRWVAPRNARRTPVRKTVRRSNTLVDALSAPRMTLYNMRSAWSKLNSLAVDMDMRSTDLCFLTEVWQLAENKKHQAAIEELLELQGIKYVSTPRPGARRGGGTALACSEKFFHLTKLNIHIPKPLEACFALVRPKNPSGKIPHTGDKASLDRCG